MMALELQGVAVAGRLKPMDLAFEPGQMIGLVGPNGSGKSTLLSVAAGLLPSAGGVRWNGTPLAKIDMAERGRLAAWVPQEARFEFGFTVRSVVAQGRFAHGDDGAGVEDALDALDLRELADRPVNRLSGGERQRVLLARALANGAPLQLWDEPLAALDVRHGLQILMRARSLSLHGGTVIMSLHDLRIAHCLDLVVMLDRGGLAAVGKPEDVLTEQRVLDVFGVRMREAPGMILELP